MIVRQSQLNANRRRRACDLGGGHEPAERPLAEKTVLNCYDLIDRIFPECGLLDFTDGIYYGDPSVSYEQAQQNQFSWLLDQVHCTSGSRLLDIGCGNGTLLEAARRRGAEAIGITVSPQQAERCRRNGLNVRLINYRDLDESWNGQFDCLIANGSIEHFVQPRDAALGWQDTIYRELFEICHRVLDPRSPSRRFATTVIHFDRFRPKRADWMRGPLSFTAFSDHFHFALLAKGMGGYYPFQGQLERCAAPYFKLIEEVDGTEDYHWTSEEWLRRVRRCFVHWKTAPRLVARLLPYMLRHPRHSALGLSLLFTASWQWQFRGQQPPMELLRQVWQTKPSPRR
jgi:cyclopropane fatty-acyl-phospholipid synthase-like methyltransferase